MQGKEWVVNANVFLCGGVKKKRVGSDGANRKKTIEGWAKEMAVKNVRRTRQLTDFGRDCSSWTLVRLKSIDELAGGNEHSNWKVMKKGENEDNKWMSKDTIELVDKFDEAKDWPKWPNTRITGQAVKRRQLTRTKLTILLYERWVIYSWLKTSDSSQVTKTRHVWSSDAFVE